MTELALADGQHVLPDTRAFTSAWDRLSNEAFIAGQLCFDWATPGRMSDHLPWATALFVTVRGTTSRCAPPAHSYMHVLCLNSPVAFRGEAAP